LESKLSTSTSVLILVKPITLYVLPSADNQGIYTYSFAILKAAVKSLPDLAKRGVKIVAPAQYALVKLDAKNTTIIPSEYATAAKAAGLEIITWSFGACLFLFLFVWKVSVVKN